MSFKVKTCNAGIYFYISVKINNSLKIFLYTSDDTIYFRVRNNNIHLIPKYGNGIWIIKIGKTITYG